MISLLTLFLWALPCAAIGIVLPPSIDPFYRPPTGYESTSPGTILRKREIIPAAFSLLPEPVKAVQLLYRTQGINGSAIATVTTIFVPKSAPQDRFVSFQAAEDSAWIDCAPSYNFQLAGVPTNAITTFENLLIQAWLASGFIVAAPDHEGPDSAFAAGRLEGYATLDGMRAAKTYLGAQAIFGTGYSGGAIATGWAASLHSLYAPDLDIRGWALGGTPANLTGTLVFVDGTVFSGFLPAAIDGLNTPSAYKSLLDPILEAIVTPYGLSRLAIAKVNCAVTDILTFAGQSILSYAFQILGPRLLYQPVVAAVLQQNIMGVNSSETPTSPVLLYHALQDEIIPYSNASTLARSWCRDGAGVRFVTYEQGGHATTEIVGLVPAIQYAKAAFEGAVGRGCVETEAATGLDVLSLGLNVEPVLVLLLNELAKIGANDENLFNVLAESS